MARPRLIIAWGLLDAAADACRGKPRRDGYPEGMTRSLGVATALAALAALAAAAQGDAGRWTTGTPLPTARSEVSVATTGGAIYVIGGYAPAGPRPVALDASGNVDVDQPLVQAYDVASGRWTDRAPLPRGLNHVGVTALGDKVYAFGGFERQNRGPVGDANVYDPATDRWTALPAVPRARGSIAVAALDGKIHLVGGRDEHSVGTHDVFDPATGRYASAAPLPVARDHLGLVPYGGKLYAIAGRIDDFAHNTSYVDVYDPAADRWTSGAPMPSQRSGMAVAVFRERIVAAGGEFGGGTFTNNEAYDPRTNAWSTLAPLPEGRHGTGAAVVGDRLYVPAGGPLNGGSRQSNTLFVFAQP
jgi:Kelch motif